MTETLTADPNISHYRIVSKIGEGGMGEINLARGARLDREVAIKVLPAGLANDAELIGCVLQCYRELKVILSDSMALTAFLSALATRAPGSPAENQTTCV